MRHLHRSARIALVLIVVARVAAAQAPSAFTAEDMLKVATVSVLDVTEDGARVATTTRRGIDNATVDNRRYGDPTYLSPANVTLQIIDAKTGAVDKPFKDALINVRDAAWTRDGKRLAILLAQDAASPDAFPTTTLHVWDAEKKTLTAVPSNAGARIAVNSQLAWTPDGSALIVALRNAELDRAARAKFKALTDGPIIVHTSSDPFLDWDLLQRDTRSRSLATLDPRTGAVKALLPQGRLSSYQVARDGSFLTIMEDVTAKTDYDVIGGTDNTLKFVDAKTGEAKVIAEAKDLKGLTLRWSDDGKTFAYAKKGEVFVQGVDGSKPRSLTPKPAKPEGDAAKAEPAAPADKADDKKKEESFSPVSFNRDGSRLLVTSSKGWYVVTVADAARTLIVPLEEEETKNPRLTAIDWSPDGSVIYATWGAREKWERGIVKIDIASKTMTPLVRDGRLFGGVRMARDGSSFMMTVSDGDRPADLYTVDSRFANWKRLTELNPWLSTKQLPKSELVPYRDADGKQLYGVLRYPVGYEKGKTYPTVFELYETFFDNGFNARAAFLANHGYAVFHPSVNLVVGQPGEAWVKGVTSAANRLIEMGIADPDKLGVQGTSYGGYATVLLITQTDRFKAAVNVSGKVDMVSFYTDSPRLGVRNTHAPEKSQDRIGGTLWEYPERYLEHSAVLRADRIKTPLLTISGDQDPNVPASQSREIYYALRRLGKEVEWVRYVNGAHRPPNSVSEAVDFEQRIVSWYDKHLKKDAAKKNTTTQASK
ncbi:MAG TPA: prolyl oligopeptidase family serine peptidase [Vicinamibacterales bacterium]